MTITEMRQLLREAGFSLVQEKGDNTMEGWDRGTPDNGVLIIPLHTNDGIVFCVQVHPRRGGRAVGSNFGALRYEQITEYAVEKQLRDAGVWPAPKTNGSYGASVDITVPLKLEASPLAGEVE